MSQRMSKGYNILGLQINMREKIVQGIDSGVFSFFPKYNGQGGVWICEIGKHGVVRKISSAVWIWKNSSVILS